MFDVLWNSYFTIFNQHLFDFSLTHEYKLLKLLWAWIVLKSFYGNNQIQLIEQRISSKGISIGFTDEAFNYLKEKGFDPLFGARPLKRLFEDEVLNPLSEVILDIGENIEDKLIFTKDKYGLKIANKNLRVLRS